MSERILIVDDDEFSRGFLAILLQGAGYVTAQADNGGAGVDLAKNFAPDLILLDVIMPGLDGYATCAALKADPGLADVPVIFLSAQNRTTDKIRGLEAGGADYITKPFDEGEVVARVRSQLRIRALSREVFEANVILRRKQERIDEDLRTAGEIQRALLPARPPEHPGLDAAWRFIPSEAVGGDIFGILEFGREHLAVYMLDVSGHGVPAALVAVSASQTLAPHGGVILTGDADLPILARITPPGAVMARLDELYPMERFDKYFTIFYMIMNTRTGEVRFSRAAHPPPLLCRADGGLEFLDEGGSIIGLGGGQDFEEGHAQLRPGDRIFLYTDGLTEYPDPDGQDYGVARLSASLRAASGLPLDQALDAALADIRTHGRGQPPADDLTLLGLGWKGPA